MTLRLRLKFLFVGAIRTTPLSNSRHATASVLALVAFCMLMFMTPLLRGQLTTGSLSGTAADSTGAVVPNAKIVLLNEETRDERSTTSNSVGRFTFAAVQPGTYTVTVSATNFKSWKNSGIPMNPGDLREVSGVALVVGASNETVEVEAGAMNLLPTDSGERSAILSSKDIERLSLEGRNISELLKVLPGVTTVPNGIGNGVGFDFTASSSTGSTIGVGLSPGGAPYRGGTSYILDGANIIDPGCNCWSIAVVNPDMTQEVKVQTSNFGADSPNGPVIVNAISKSGGSSYHGQAYLYARNSALNANSWANDQQGTPKQAARYYYPGGNIGGPIKVPGTNFNHNDKLLFWAGYEYYNQLLPSSTPLESFVPTAAMEGGNFTSGGAGNAALCPNGFTASATNWCNNLSGTVAPDGTAITGGVIPSQYLDSGAAALMKMFPAANTNPASTPGGYNFYLPISTQENGYVWRARVDYNFSDNTKLFVTYQTGSNGSSQPAHIYYNPSYAVPYQGGTINNPTVSRVLTGNLVHIFSPTLTNEFVAAWGYASSPYTPSDLQAAYKSTLGYGYGTIYSSAAKLAPSINSAGAQTFPDMSQPDLWEDGGSYPSVKANPAFSDNVTKVYKSHTLKFGAYTDLASNRQGTYAYPNGNLSFNSGLQPNEANPTVRIGSLNPVANLAMGVATAFTQNNYMPIEDMAYRTTSAYLMDDWKVASRLTVNVGLRWDHVGRWYDRQGTGLAVWLPGRYASDLNSGKVYPGVYWHAIDPGIPVGGSPTRLAFTSPRLGVAWNIDGAGRTIVRGGWGEYRWNDQFNDYGGDLSTAQLMTTYNSPSGQSVTLSHLGQLGSTAAATASLPSAVSAADPNDYEVPNTEAWNLTIDRQLPWQSLFEIAYVGNTTRHLLMGGQSSGSDIGGSGFTNVNKIPVGGLFQPDPVTGAAAPSDPDNTSTYTLADYYPYYAGYGSNSISVGEHVGYSNYHGLQIAWLKQAGRLSFDVNYTWSKSLGMINSTVDAFNVRGNYGVLNIDRPQVINTSYAYDLGRLYRGDHRLIGGTVNGWTISGTTTWQSGGNLQAQDTQNLGLTILNSTKNESLTSNTYFGTNANEILPIMTCNPKSGLQAHQLLNLSCFSAPAVGQQGLRQFPYLSGPSYNNSDLTIYKTFAITGRQKVQFRASAFNFMNHPLWGFSTSNDITLKYATTNGTTFTPNVASGLPTGYTWGTMDTKSGSARVLELSLKYSF
ncbi:TonB-dependent receptor [Granulicella sp. S156]|jgi:Carboxypeptidase regulatory-like domain|uniref:TonB-dependent receptor n=1 Tax=Granulicella sp. S156 TaxID=1747224 RepID=UPI00131DEC33|nr:TonB-dependent receptor [Granulicella sp. S156]